MALTGTISTGSGITASVKALKPTAIVSPSFESSLTINELTDIKNVDTVGVQDNFYLVYDAVDSKWKAEVLNIRHDTANTPIVIANGEADVAANVSVTGNLSPSSDQEYDLGTSSNRWRDLYLSGSSMNLGGVEMQADAVNGGVIFIPKVTGTNPDPTAVIFKTDGQIVTAVTSGGVVSQAALNAANSSVGLSISDVAGFDVDNINGGSF